MNLKLNLLGRLLLVLLPLFLIACAGPPPAPGSSNATYQGTPDGYYRVKKGDSLYAIAFRFGLDWRQIAQLNNIASPYVIHPDQLIRIGSTASQGSSSSQEITGSGVQTAAVPTRGSETRTLETSRASTTRAYDPQPDSSNSTASDVAQTSAASETATSAVGTGTSSAKGSKQPAGVSYTAPAGDPDRWLWPTDGRIISRFQTNDPTRKGIDIGGQAGQKVVASASGEVVYSGSGLIGYGELIIIKHSDRMLSAYAHNQKRLVSEGEQVTAGSSIAEMGTNDRNQAILHFEIRVNGVPTDPLNFLPQR